MNNNIPEWILRAIEFFIENEGRGSITLHLKPNKDIQVEYRILMGSEMDTKWIFTTEK